MYGNKSVDNDGAMKKGSFGRAGRLQSVNKDGKPQVKEEEAA